jgi:hypothetical protein
MAYFASATACAAPSSSSAHISLALSVLTFLKSSSQKEFCRIGGAIDPFTSIHSIHLFVRWLSSLPMLEHLSSDLLLVAWAVKGLPAGLKSFLEWSLGLEGAPKERINLEYLVWHLEMWRSVFSSKIVVEDARQRGKGQGVHIADWYANAPALGRVLIYGEAQRYWDRLSGKSGMCFSRCSCFDSDYLSLLGGLY